MTPPKIHATAPGSATRSIGGAALALGLTALVADGRSSLATTAAEAGAPERALALCTVIVVSAALAAALSLLLLLARLLLHAAPARLAPQAAALLAGAPLAAGMIVLTVELTRGPRIASWPGTTWLRVLVLLLALPVSHFLARHALRRVAAGSRTAGILALLLAGAALVADARILVGHYPALHVGLTVSALLSAALAGALLLRPGAIQRRGVNTLGVAGCLLLGTGVLPGDDPVVRHLTLDATPVTGRLIVPLLPEVTRVSKPGTEERARALLAPAAALPASALDAALPRRREFKIVWITIDTLRNDHVGYMGYARPTTPELDALARDAVVFRTAYAPYPSSPLSMAAMFKGLLPGATDAFEHQSGRFEAARGWRDVPLARCLAAGGRSTTAFTALPGWFVDSRLPFLRDGFAGFQQARGHAPEDAAHVVSSVIDRLTRTEDLPDLLWVHLFDPHAPYVPRPDFPFGDRPIDHYDAEIAHTDRQLGRLLRFLRKRNDWDRVVLLVHADHGEEFGEHGGLFHGAQLHEEQVRVPLVLRVPGVAPRRVDRPVSLVDLPVTLLRLLGAGDPGPTHGRSLLPLALPDLAGATGRQREERPVFLDLAGRQLGVRLGRFKLVRDDWTGTDTFFDLQTDPTERRPILRPGFPEAGLLAALADLQGADRRAARTRPRPAEAGRLLGSTIERLVRAGDVTRAERALWSVPMRALRGELQQHAERLARDERPAARRIAIVIAAALRTAPLRPLAARLLDDGDADVRRETLLALPALGGEAAGLAGRLLRDPDPGVARAARLASGLLGDDASRGPLREILQSGTRRERLLAALALARLGDGRFVSAGRAILCTSDLSPSVRWTGLLTGISCEPAATLLALRELQRDEPGPFTDEAALEAARLAGPLACLPLLRGALESESPDAGREAARLMDRTGRGGWRRLLADVRRLEAAARGLAAAAPAEGCLLADRAMRAAARDGLVDWGPHLLRWRLAWLADDAAGADRLARDLARAPAAPLASVGAALPRSHARGEDASTSVPVVSVELLWQVSSPTRTLALLVRAPGGGLPVAARDAAPALALRPRTGAGRDLGHTTYVPLVAPGLRAEATAFVIATLSGAALPTGTASLRVDFVWPARGAVQAGCARVLLDAESRR